MRTLAFLTVVSLLAVPALADWDPGDGHKMHFPQLPDFNGWDVAATQTGQPPDLIERHVADDWQCSESGPVEGIHFWGSWKNDDVGTIDFFYISIWLDDPPGPGGYFDDNPYSMPLYRQPDGSLGEVWYYGVYPGEFTSRLYGTGNQGWYDPHDGSFLVGDHFQVFQYNVDCSTLPNPFIQEQGQIYWLMIQAHSSDGTEWGWKTSLDHWNDDATYFDAYTVVPPGYPHSGWTDLPAWMELFDPLNGDSLDMAFVITGPEEPGEEFQFEFSLDIGSDTELSDPFRDGDEGFDPGDVYWWQGPPVIFPGRDGFKDDEGIFGVDPWPDPPDPTYATAVPVGFGSIQDYFEYFDLDGHDQIDIDLTDVTYPFLKVPSQCIWDPYYLLFSYDDDMWDGWPVWDVPVMAPSSGGMVYGTTFGKDEVWGINLVPTGGPAPYPIQVVYPYADEVTVHASLAPNPDATEEEDDDVDSLDVVPFVATGDACPYWYFSPDHEAMLGLDPGGIFLVVAGGPVQVIDEAFHLGVSEDADIDAFEFVWHIDPEFLVPTLGIVFSVDEDDTLTTGVDESGGLDPRMIYASSMTGWYWPLLDEDRLWDDVDALTSWHTALGGCPNPGGSGSFCSADCVPNDGDGIWNYTVDGDCIVNLQDLAKLLANYGTTAGATREDGDVFPAYVGDGAVNLQDLAALLSQYGDNCN